MSVKKPRKRKGLKLYRDLGLKFFYQCQGCGAWAHEPAAISPCPAAPARGHKFVAKAVK